MRRQWLLLSLLLGVGCKKDTAVASVPAMEEGALLDHLAARSVPDVVRARFSIRMKSKPLGISAPPLGGGLVVDRPDRAYLAIMNPVGGTVLSIATNGERLMFVNHRDREAFVDEAAAHTLQEATEGELSIREVVDVLLGLLPVSADQLRRKRRDGDALRMRFVRPGNVALTAWVDPGRGTPRRVELSRSGSRNMVEVDYGPFEWEGDTLLPTRVTVRVPSVDLRVELRFRNWSPLATAPDVFSPEVPDRFTARPLSDVSQGLQELADDEQAGARSGGE